MNFAQLQECVWLFRPESELKLHSLLLNSSTFSCQDLPGIRLPATLVRISEEILVTLQRSHVWQVFDYPSITEMRGAGWA